MRSHVQIWDVGCQRQVEIIGPDANRFVQSMTPRDISGARIGHCLYLPIVDRDGGIVNDPILLKLGEDRYWLSIADSDVSLFALGLAQGLNMDLRVREPDVWPLSVQGPKAANAVSAVFGEAICGLGKYRFGAFDFRNTRQIVARTGYSSQDGFEIFLEGSSLGEELWDVVLEAGRPFGMVPGCPNLIDRIEAGLISYGNEVTRDNNPLEAGLEKFCSLSKDIDCLGLPALRAIAERGVRRRIRGVLFGNGACPPCVEPFTVFSTGSGGQCIGQVTSAAYSPRLERNVGLAMMEKPQWNAGQPVYVRIGDEQFADGEISDLPFQ